jgi:protein FAM32A
MSDYSFRPGGSLKLKGGVTEGGIVKKYAFIAYLFYVIYILFRKKKPKGDQTSKGVNQDEGQSSKASPSGSGRNSPALGGSSDDKKTAAEKRFQEVQRKRVCYSFVPSEILYSCACAT